MSKQSVEVVALECKTPPQTQTQSQTQTPTPIPISEDIPKPETNKSESIKCKPSPSLGTPDRLKVPKPFKYPERYTSPTDNIMSPISKGLLARSRRVAALLPPSLSGSKIHELRHPSSQNVGQMRLKMES